MKFILFSAIALLLIGCSGNSGNIPEGDGSLLGLCSRAPKDLRSAGFDDEVHLESYLSDLKVEKVNAISRGHLVQFAVELAKIPHTLNKKMAEMGIGIRIMAGEGVNADPSFESYGDRSSDGRKWNQVVGVGTNPTRVVVNHLYDDHGSVNLVIHERAHTMDLYWKYYSSSDEWRLIMKEDSAFLTIMKEYCGDYCTKNPVEAFAEAFAMFYSCGSSRSILKKAPRTFNYIQSLN